MRHPFYLANALIDAGLVVMAGWWPLAVVLPLWWLAIYIPVIRGEERYLTENFPDEYPAYKRRVPCLIPWRRPLPHVPATVFAGATPTLPAGKNFPGRCGFWPIRCCSSWSKVSAAAGWPWLNDGWNLTGLAGLIMLYVLAWELHGHQRQQRWILPRAMRHPMLRVVASAAILAAVCYVPAPRTSFQDFVPIGGAVLMLLSVPVFSRRPVRAVHGRDAQPCWA